MARVYAAGAQSQPLDIAVVSPETAYVTTRSSTQLLRLNLDTGAAYSRCICFTRRWMTFGSSGSSPDAESLGRSLAQRASCR